jgi:energy-coupling factor transporter ATP-binding protein EcfA2
MSAPAARAANLSYRFADGTQDVLRRISWEIAAGSVTVVVGASGAGKTTLLRCLNGLIPHFHGGCFGGDVTVLGANTRGASPRDFAPNVGFVFQDPEAQFVTDRVDDEIVFGMEHLGYPRATMRLRLEETLDLLGIHHLRHREVATLSGGERQRVALAAALATRPHMLVLDEPTSQLDPLAAHDVLAAVERLNRDLGMTVVLAEHRLDRVLPFAERIVALEQAGLSEGPVQEQLTHLADVPPLVALAREQGWSPLPVTVREALPFLPEDLHNQRVRSRRNTPGDELVRAEGLHYRYGQRLALAGVSVSARQGEVLALLGRNGSGKTTLLKLLMGLLRPERGRVLLRGRDIARVPVQQIAGTAAYVPQHPTAILHQESVLEELRYTARVQHREVDPLPVLERLRLAGHAARHPLDLSGGERQRVALAAIAVTEPPILLLDEPTRGLPGADKRLLARFAQDYADAGRVVIVATHDVEFAAIAANRILLLADGEVVADGPPHDVLAGSLAFGTQLNRLCGGRVLTLDDARAALARR